MSRINDTDFSKLNLIQEVFREGPVVVFRWSDESDWPVDFVTENVGRILGYTASSFLSGKVKYAEIIHPHDLRRVKDEVRYNSENNVISFKHKDYRIVKSSGEIIWVGDQTNIIRNEKGEIKEYIGYIYDQTNKIKKEIELKEIRDRYYHIMKATREGVWDWDLRSDTVHFSKRWKEMLGHTDNEVGTSLQEWEKRVHPDDIEQCYEDIKSHLDGKSPIYENIHRVLHKNGHYLWILDRGIKILNDQGETYRMIGTHQNITSQRLMEQKLRKLTITDELTGLFNRRHYYDIIEKEMARTKRYGADLTLLMIDIDHFKVINDKYGHSCGDYALKQFANCMKINKRKTDEIFRLGGEEFCIVAPNTCIDSATVLAERIRQEAEKLTVKYEGNEIKFTISIGISCCKPNICTVDEILSHADEALYESKRNGRNRVTVKTYD